MGNGLDSVEILRQFLDLPLDQSDREQVIFRALARLIVYVEDARTEISILSGKMDERFDAVDRRFDTVELGLVRVEERITGLEEGQGDLSSGQNGIMTKLENVEDMLGKVQGDTETLNQRLNEMDRDK